jgi:hypothetical protein
MKQKRDKKLTLYEEVWTLFYENNDTVNTELMLKSSVEEFGTTLGTIYLKLSEANTTAPKKMEEDFYKMDEILEEEVDPAMQLIHAANIQFYNDYFALRALKNTDMQHKQESAMAM